MNFSRLKPFIIMSIHENENNCNSEFEFLFVKPERVNYWSYQFDGGVRHSLREDKVYPYVASFLDSPVYRHSVIDIMQRHQPFLVNLREKTVIELHPEEDTEIYHRTQIRDELSSVLSLTEGKRDSLFRRVDRTYQNFISKRG